MGEKGITDQFNKTKNIGWFLAGMAGGWLADRFVIQYLVENFSKWLGVAASTMDTEIGFFFGLIFAILLVKMYGHTLGIVIQGTLFGYALNRGVVLYMEHKDWNTDHWYLTINLGRETAVHLTAGAHHLLEVVPAGIPLLQGVVF